MENAPDRAAVLPSGVEVLFPGRPCSLEIDPSADWTERVTPAQALGLPTKGHPGTFAARTEVAAIFDGTGPEPANRTVLRALAERLAADYYSWRSVAFDRVYSGIVAPAQCGLIDETLWTHREGDCSTRIRSAPYDRYPDRFHHVGLEDCPAREASCARVYGPAAKLEAREGGGKVILLPKYDVCIDGDQLASTFAGYDEFPVCCQESSSGDDDGDCAECYDALPDTLALTDDFGSIVLYKDPSCRQAPDGGSCCYFGGGRLAVPGRYGIPEDDLTGVECVDSGEATIDSARSYCLFYDSGGWKLRRFYLSCAGDIPPSETLLAAGTYGWVPDSAAAGQGDLYSPTGGDPKRSLSIVRSQVVACAGTTIGECQPLLLSATFPEGSPDFGFVTIHSS